MGYVLMFHTSSRDVYILGSTKRHLAPNSARIIEPVRTIMAIWILKDDERHDWMIRLGLRLTHRPRTAVPVGRLTTRRKISRVRTAALLWPLCLIFMCEHVMALFFVTCRAVGTVSVLCSEFEQKYHPCIYKSKFCDKAHSNALDLLVCPFNHHGDPPPRMATFFPEVLFPSQEDVEKHDWSKQRLLLTSLREPDQKTPSLSGRALDVENARLIFRAVPANLVRKFLELERANSHRSKVIVNHWRDKLDLPDWLATFFATHVDWHELCTKWNHRHGFGCSVTQCRFQSGHRCAICNRRDHSPFERNLVQGRLTYSCQKFDTFVKAVIALQLMLNNSEQLDYFLNRLRGAAVLSLSEDFGAPWAKPVTNALPASAEPVDAPLTLQLLRVTQEEAKEGQTALLHDDEDVEDPPILSELGPELPTFNSSSCDSDALTIAPVVPVTIIDLHPEDNYFKAYLHITLDNIHVSKGGNKLSRDGTNVYVYKAAMYTGPANVSPQMVAVKLWHWPPVLDKKRLADSKMYKDLMTEVSCIQQIGHEVNSHVMTILSTKRELRINNVDYFCLISKLEHSTLNDLCEKNINGFWLRSFLRQLLCGLCALHAKGVYHRDIKPENILVAMNPETEEMCTQSFGCPHLKFCDFALSKIILGDTKGASYTNSVQVGTEGYTAPESSGWNGPSKTKETSDLWSMGCVVYFLANHGTKLFNDAAEITELHKTHKEWQKVLQKHGEATARAKYEDMYGEQPKLLDLSALNSQPMLKHLVTEMLHFTPDARISCKNAARHPACWEPNYAIENITALMDMSNNDECTGWAAQVMAHLDEKDATLRILGNDPDWPAQSEMKWEDLSPTKSCFHGQPPDGTVLWKGQRLQFKRYPSQLVRCFRNMLNHFKAFGVAGQEMAEIKRTLSLIICQRFPMLLVVMFEFHIKNNLPWERDTLPLACADQKGMRRETKSDGAIMGWPKHPV
jgi:serine/threonine protein kinase